MKSIFVTNFVLVISLFVSLSSNAESNPLEEVKKFLPSGVSNGTNSEGNCYVKFDQEWNFIIVAREGETGLKDNEHIESMYVFKSNDEIHKITKLEVSDSTLTLREKDSGDHSFVPLLPSRIYELNISKSSVGTNVTIREGLSISLTWSKKYSCLLK